ncbi:hypothetical protein [Lutibacter sp.]
MKKQFLNLGKALSKAEQREIFGGEVLTHEGGVGNCTVGCNSGAQIENAPDCSESTMNFACANQGGASICSCLLN